LWRFCIFGENAMAKMSLSQVFLFSQDRKYHIDQTKRRR
jgi:hypothetical protein